MGFYASERAILMSYLCKKVALLRNTQLPEDVHHYLGAFSDDTLNVGNITSILVAYYVLGISRNNCMEF